MGERKYEHSPFSISVCFTALPAQSKTKTQSPLGTEMTAEFRNGH